MALADGATIHGQSPVTGLAETIIPLVSIQIASDPLSAQQIDSILPQGHTISDTRRVIMYARREPDNRMVFGSMGKLDRNNDISGHEWLIREAVRFLGKGGDNSLSR